MPGRRVQDLPQHPAFQPSVDPATERVTSYSSHNPTLTPDLALIAWHSGGLRAIDIANPVRPRQGGWFSPTPLASVANEDPALSAGPNKVVMWSYPIAHDGLIHVIDIRNELYILRYTGREGHPLTRRRLPVTIAAAVVVLFIIGLIVYAAVQPVVSHIEM
jgi:hypothetical protein